MKSSPRAESQREASALSGSRKPRLEYDLCPPDPSLCGLAACAERSNIWPLPDTSWAIIVLNFVAGTVWGLAGLCFHYRGFKRFAAALGLGVFCHNLVVLAKQTMT